MKIDRKIELFLLGIGVLIAVIALIPSFGQWLDPRTPSASPSPDEVVTTLSATPVPTKKLTPTSTNTPRPQATPMPTIDADPTVYDNFDNPVFDGKWNTGLWSLFSDSGNVNVHQQDGILTISRRVADTGGLETRGLQTWKMDDFSFVEAKVKLDSDMEASSGAIGIEIDGFVDGNWWWLTCMISSNKESLAQANCQAIDNYSADGFSVQYDTWYTIRVKTDPDASTLTFFVDNREIGTYTPSDWEAFKNAELGIQLLTWTLDGGLVQGYLDEIRIGQ